MRLPQLSRRRGFTLIELLIVCAIILILMGLTLGAVVRYRDVQQKQNSQMTLGKVDSALHQHWNAVINAANNEQISSQAITLAGTDQLSGKRARVIHIKLRLMQEFPISFAEVRSGKPNALPPKQSYQLALANAPGSGLVQGNKAYQCNYESAACLYLALQENRNGTNTNVDNILTSREVLSDPNVSSIKFIADDWRTPIAFFRWPYQNTDLNPATGANARQNNLDLEDPDGLLSMRGAPNLQGILGYPTGTGRSYRLDPTVASAGRDGYFGLDAMDQPSCQPPASMHTMNALYTYDNLYSYRLRQTGRGD